MAPPTQAQIVVFDRSFGESGDGEDTTCFRMPRYLCCLPNGNLCIADSLNERLLIVTPDGALVKSLCEAGAEPGKLRGPSGLASDGSNLFVCEAGNHRVQKLRVSAGAPSKAGAGTSDSDADMTSSADGAAVNVPPDGLAADGTSKDAPVDGAPLGRAGHHGAKKAHELWCPQGCAVSKRFSTETRELFVADSINGRVVVYDAGSMEHVRTFGERGSGSGQLLYPSGVALPAEGSGMDPQVFVSELGNHRISTFSKKGGFERHVGEKGTLPGQFMEPRGITFAKGWLLVADSKRITILSPAGEFKQVIELPGAGLLWGACSALDGKRAYVTDVRAGNAKVFCLDVVGSPYDDGASPAEVAARLASAKKAAEEEKLKEWQAQRAAGKKGD